MKKIEQRCNEEDWAGVYNEEDWAGLKWRRLSRGVIKKIEQGCNWKVLSRGIIKKTELGCDKKEESLWTNFTRNF